MGRVEISVISMIEDVGDSTRYSSTKDEMRPRKGFQLFSGTSCSWRLRQAASAPCHADFARGAVILPQKFRSSMYSFRRSVVPRCGACHRPRDHCLFTRCPKAGRAFSDSCRYRSATPSNRSVRRLSIPGRSSSPDSGSALPASASGAGCAVTVAVVVVACVRSSLFFQSIFWPDSNISIVCTII